VGDLVRINDRITVHDDKVWRGDGSLVTKIRSLVSNARPTIDNEHVVTYSLLPGTYGFLLTPFAFLLGEVNVLYYGKEATVSAKALENGPILNTIQRIGYRVMQRLTVAQADLTFVRDPRIMSERNSTIRFSKPISDLDLTGLSATQVDDPCGKEPITLLFVGKFRKAKGIEYLIRGFALLDQQLDRELRLRLIGDGDIKQSLESLAVDLGVREQILFTGYINDPERLQIQFQESDIFVLPSISEGFPRVLNEALAAGLPIVTTRVGGIPAILEQERDALLVNARSEEELADAIKRIILDEDLRRTLVERGRKRSDDLNGDPVSQQLVAIRSALK
jgi:glycosyltransferase involved in cell wall biosynthesis